MIFSKKKPAATAPGIPLPAIAVRGGVVLAAILGLYAMYTIIWMAVSAAVGIAVLGALALGGFAAIATLPMLGQTLENWVLKMRKAEARRNPVEQLQNLLQLRVQQVDGVKKATALMGSGVRTMESMLEQRKSAGKNIAQQEVALAALKSAYKQRLAKLATFETGLSQMKEQIEDADWQQQFFKIHRDAETAGGDVGTDATNQMLAAEAFGAANENFNRIFADLEVEAATINDTKQVEYGGGVTLDMTALELPTIQAARR